MKTAQWILWITAACLVLWTSLASAQERIDEGPGSNQTYNPGGMQAPPPSAPPGGGYGGYNAPPAQPNSYDGYSGGYDGGSMEPTGGEGDVPYPSVEGDAITRYEVRSGDTLWDICARLLGSPWYWQKVWAMNPQIANPHWIYPGNIIYFHQAGTMGTMVGMEDQTAEQEMEDIPEIMDAEAWGKVSEGGKYELQQYMTKLNSSSFNFYNFRRDGFIARNELKYSGRIAGSPEEAIYLSEHDIIYIKPQKKAALNLFSIGQSYQIFRQMGKVEHPVTGDKIGYKIKVLGKCVIKRINDNVVTAQIIGSYDPIEFGDLVRPWKSPVKDIRPQRNKVTMGGYIVDTLEDNLVLAEHQIVFLDKGISHGVEEGNRLFVIRKFMTDMYDALDKDELPYEKIGELIVLSAGSKTSVALVSRSLVELKAGDKVTMEKNY